MVFIFVKWHPLTLGCKNVKQTSGPTELDLEAGNLVSVYWKKSQQKCILVVIIWIFIRIHSTRLTSSESFSKAGISSQWTELEHRWLEGILLQDDVGGQDGVIWLHYYSSCLTTYVEVEIHFLMKIIDLKMEMFPDNLENNNQDTCILILTIFRRFY